MANPEYPDYPMGQDPSAVFAERLAASQAQGLPLSATLGAPGVGTPGQARPALAPVTLQGNQMSTMEKIGNIMQSFGAGTQGQLAPWQQIEQAQQDRALRQQQLAQQQEMQNAQMPHLQAQTAMLGIESLQKLSAYVQSLPEDQQAAAAAAYAPTLVNLHSLATAGPQGIPAAPFDHDMAMKLLMTPGLTQTWLANQQDANPEDLKAARLMKVPDADAFLAKRRTERITALMPVLEKRVGAYIEALRQSDPNTPVTQQRLEKDIGAAIEGTPDAALQAQYGASKGMAEAAVSDWFASPKSKEFLTRRGVAIGGQTPRELGIEGMADYIQKNPDFIKAGIQIGEFGTLPAALRGKILTEAKASQQADAGKVASITGYAGAMAAARAKMDEPLIVSNPSLMPVVVKSEQPLDRTGNSMAAVQKMGGEKVVRFLNEKQWEAFGAAKEMETILGQYVQVAKVLTATPGANFGQAAKFYAQTFMGQDNPGVALAALEGSKLRIARALQGSSQSLSNLDVKTTDAMIPKATDTIQVALHKLEIAATIVETMKKVQLGQAEMGSLLGKIQQAQTELNTSKTPQARQLLQPGQRLIEGPGGLRKVAPGSGTLPEGWKDVTRE